MLFYSINFEVIFNIKLTLLNIYSTEDSINFHKCLIKNIENFQFIDLISINNIIHNSYEVFSKYYVFFYILIDEDETIVEVYKRREFWIFTTPIYNKKNFLKKKKKNLLKKLFNTILTKIILETETEKQVEFIKDDKLLIDEDNWNNLDNLNIDEIIDLRKKKKFYRTEWIIDNKAYDTCKELTLDNLFKQTAKNIKFKKMEKKINKYTDYFYHSNNLNFFLKNKYYNRYKINIRLHLKIKTKKLIKIIIDLENGIKSFFNIDYKNSIDNAIIDDFEKIQLKNQYFTILSDGYEIYVLTNKILLPKAKIKIKDILLMINFIFLEKINFTRNNIYYIFFKKFIKFIFLNLFYNFIIKSIKFNVKILNIFKIKKIKYIIYNKILMLFFENTTGKLIFNIKNYFINLIRINSKLNINFKYFLYLDINLYTRYLIKPLIFITYINKFLKNKYKNFSYKFFYFLKYLYTNYLINKNYFKNFIKNTISQYKFCKNYYNYKLFTFFKKIINNYIYINFQEIYNYLKKLVTKIIKYNDVLRIYFFIINYHISIYINKFNKNNYFKKKNLIKLYSLILLYLNKHIKIIYLKIIKYFFFYFKKIHIIIIYNYIALLYILGSQTNYIFYIIINIYSIFYNTFFKIKGFFIYIYSETLDNIILLNNNLNTIKFYIKKLNFIVNIAINQNILNKILEIVIFIYNLDNSYLFLRSLKTILLFLLNFIKKINLFNNYFVYFLKLNLWNFSFKHPEYSWTLESYILRNKGIKKEYLKSINGITVSEKLKMYLNYKGLTLFKKIFIYFDIFKTNSFYLTTLLVYAKRCLKKKNNEIFNSKKLYQYLKLSLKNKIFFDYYITYFLFFNYIYVIKMNKLDLIYNKNIKTIVV